MILLSLLPWCWSYKYVSSHLDFHMGSTDKTKASALPTGSSSQPSRYSCSHGLDSSWIIYAWLQGDQQLIRTCFQHDNGRSTRGPCLNTKSHFKALFPSHCPKQGTEPSPKLKNEGSTLQVKKWQSLCLNLFCGAVMKCPRLGMIQRKDVC